MLASDISSYGESKTVYIKGEWTSTYSESSTLNAQTQEFSIRFYNPCVDKAITSSNYIADTEMEDNDTNTVVTPTYTMTSGTGCLIKARIWYEDTVNNDGWKDFSSDALFSSQLVDATGTAGGWDAAAGETTFKLTEGRDTHWPQKSYNIRIEVYNVLKESLNATWEFKLTLVQVCTKNVLSQITTPTDIKFIINGDGSGTPTPA